MNFNYIWNKTIVAVEPSTCTANTPGSVQDLVCDGVSHCGHGQDEDVTNNCAGQLAAQTHRQSG